MLCDGYAVGDEVPLAKYLACEGMEEKTSGKQSDKCFSHESTNLRRVGSPLSALLKR